MKLATGPGMIEVLVLATLLPAVLTLASLDSRVKAQELRELLHPDFPLLDGQGTNVLNSDQPVSPTRTCAVCHDTNYIEAHSFHADAGLVNLDEGASLDERTKRPWERSSGLFGGWDPIRYRTLTRPGVARIDLGVADWIRTLGGAHTGGGPAMYTQSRTRLDEAELGPQTRVWNAETHTASNWDWKQSGVYEHDCFVCHLGRPDDESRRAELAAGRFRWAPTATLGLTGLVERDEANRGWRYKREAFRSDGSLDVARLAAVGSSLSDPRSQNCGICHGPVHLDEDPLVLQELRGQWNMETRGQIFSAQRMNVSGFNLENKQTLHRPFDVHAERLLRCVDCHHAPNNPAYGAQSSASNPEHLAFDARRLSIGEYLQKPNHNLAHGRDGSMRDCADCHRMEQTHDWLPYREQHAAALRCEACHIPHVHAPARRMTDWTVLTSRRGPRVEYRGVDGPVDSPASLIGGYDPALLPRLGADGVKRLAPHNVMASWYWVEADPVRPVRRVDLEAAFFEGDNYHSDIVRALDDNADMRISESELRLDTDEKVTVVKARLIAVGVRNPHIEAELRPFGLHHGVAAGDFALRDCRACHSARSRMSAAVILSSFLPGEVLPAWQGDDRVGTAGELLRTAAGGLEFRPDSAEAGFYVIGHDRVAWIDVLGILAAALVFLGAGGHAILRILSARKRSATS